MFAARSRQKWKDQARDVSYRNQCFIGNRFVPAVSGKTFTCVNPATGRALTQVSAGGEEDVSRAVKAARAVFEQGMWSRIACAERKKILLRLADLMQKHATELALLQTLDMGAPIGDSIRRDVPLSIGCVRHHAIAVLRRGPLGVVGAVIPWNFPLLMASRKIGLALAAGNSAIVTPAEQSPLSILRLAELAAEAGLPAGVLNVIPCQSRAAREAIESKLHQVLPECGRRAPKILMAATPDLDAAVEAAAWGAFHSHGTACNTSSRLIIQEPIKDAVLETIRKVAQLLQPGDPLAPGTRMGPMADEAHMKRVLGCIESGIADGARLVFGGRRVRSETGGYFVEPTLFDGVKNSMRLAQEEMVGPVLSIITVKGEEADWWLLAQGRGDEGEAPGHASPHSTLRASL